ncbi:glycosyltransferase [Roseomonas sp. BN140053]|uniref:glycosyltransferase n=1 Tax=Roseomonas sp. BN140053 TaxID=3391898 RepID=UPI0039E7A51F
MTVLLAATLLLAAVVFFLLAAHPFVTYPASLRLLARRRPRPIQRSTPRGTAALCLCAYNEESVIVAKVTNMLAMREAVPDLEILVYVDAATDGTAALLQDYANQIRLVVSPERLGKTHGMNTLVRLTRADYLVFSDANVTFAADALPRLLAPFGDPEVGAVCGHLQYAAENGSATAATGLRYWRLEEEIKALESATGSVMGADGSIFAIRRSLHCPPPADLIDDMYVSLMVLCQGARVVRASDAMAFEEAVSRPAEEFRRKVRIACQAFNVHRTLRPRLRQLGAVDRYKYVSHKLLRWLTVYLLAASALCLFAGLAAAGAGWLWAILLALSAVGAALIWQARRGPLASLRDILGAFLATGIGVWRSLRGDRFQTWSPPASARLSSTMMLPGAGPAN